MKWQEKQFHQTTKSGLSRISFALSAQTGSVSFESFENSEGVNAKFLSKNLIHFKWVQKCILKSEPSRQKYTKSSNLC